MWLRIATGPDTGRSVQVSGEIVLGRERGVDLVVRDERASRRHVSVAPAPGDRVLVRDLGSANGTQVDERSITEVSLAPGQRFAIGDTEIEVLAAAPVAPAGNVAPRGQAPEGHPESVGQRPSLAAKRAAAEVLAEAARKAREQRESKGSGGGKLPSRPTYSGVGRLIEQSTRRHRRITWAALGVAAVAIAAVSFLLARSDDRVPEVVAQLSPSTVLIDVSAEGARTATGSGWVLDAKEGLIVTNAHVVNEGTSFAVVAGGRRRAARIHASAPCEDLALLKVSDPGGLQAARLGDQVVQGETVVALGFPQDAGVGTTLSATRGVVSAASTTFEDPAADVPPYPEVIQTDTALNPGNSGGPLADLEGRVIGVNAAARTSGSGGRPLQNQNYAIPISRAREVFEDLRKGISHGWLGANFGYPSAEALAEAKQPPGLYVTGIVKGTAAAKTGLGLNDLIISINERPIAATLASWCDVVKDRPSGSTVFLLVNTPDGDQREFEVKLG